jgi:hypothetical protein
MRCVVEPDVLYCKQKKFFYLSKSTPKTIKNDYGNNKQDALYRLIYYSKLALHVLAEVFAHHQENLTASTISGSAHSSCCRLVSQMYSFETPTGNNLGEQYQIL